MSNTIHSNILKQSKFAKPHQSIFWSQNKNEILRHNYAIKLFRSLQGWCIYQWVGTYFRVVQWSHHIILDSDKSAIKMPPRIKTVVQFKWPTPYTYTVEKETGSFISFNVGQSSYAEHHFTIHKYQITAQLISNSLVLCTPCTMQLH